MSQEELARRAAIDRTWVSHLEYGRANPSWATVRRIAGALGVSVAELATLADELEGGNDPPAPQR